MRKATFGILAEDETDVRVARVLIERLLDGQPKGRFGLQQRAAQGCSMLERKLKPWMSELATAGCTHIIILRDLDRTPQGALNDEKALRKKLEGVPTPDSIQRLVCIAIEELEAWFWSDPKVVQHVGRGAGKAHSSPHLLRCPKEALIRLSRDAGHKPRYSTNTNEELARLLNLELCAEKCPSFREFRDFVLKALLPSK